MKSNEKQVYSGIVWAFAERFASQFVSIVVAIVLARILAPELFGVISIVTVIIAICNVFVTGGFGNALVQKKNADELDFSTILIFSFIFSLFVYALAYYSAKPIADFYDMPELVIVIRLMALRLPIASINSVQQAYVSREMKFKMMFFVTVFGAFVSGVIGIIMALMGFGVYALVGQFLISMLSDTIVLSLVLKINIRFKFSYIRLKQLFPFGLSVMLSELAGTLSDNVRTIVVGKGFSASQLAFYAKGNQFPSVIVANVNTAMGKVLFPALAKEQDSENELSQLSKRILQTSLYILTPLLLLLTFCADPLVKILYNNQWYDMIPYIQVLSLSYILVPIHTTSLQRIKANGLGKAYLIIQIIKISIGLLLMFASVYLFDDAIYVAYSYLAAVFINTIIHYIVNKKLFNQSYKSQWEDIYKIANINAIMAIVLLFMSSLDAYPLLSFCAKTTVGFALYVLLSKCMNVPIYPQLKSLIIKSINKKYAWMCF